MIDRVVGDSRRRIGRVWALAALILVLLAPSVAVASGSSTCNAYNPQTCSSVGATSVTTGASPSGAKTSGALPFTGLDLVLLAAGGATLTGAGLMLRRLTRRLD